MTTGRVNQVARCLFFRWSPEETVVLFELSYSVINFVCCCRLCLSLLRVCAKARSSVDSFDKSTECRPGKLVVRGQTWWFFYKRKNTPPGLPQKSWRIVISMWNQYRSFSIFVVFFVKRKTTQFSFDQRDPRAERSAFHTMNRLVAGSYALVSSGTFTV